MSAFIKKLEQLFQQKAIEAIDVERCRFFRKQEPDISDDVLKAIFLTGYRFRQGDVCILLEDYARQFILSDIEPLNNISAPVIEQWLANLKQSAMVGKPGDFAPLILDEGNRLYFHKYWQQEETLAKSLLARCVQNNNIDDGLLREGLDRLFGVSGQPDWQKVAAAISVRNNLSVISGGPGTGKTTTVVRILALLAEQCRAGAEPFDVALAAPTGKAAARLKESIRGAKQGLDADETIKGLIPDEASTLHQLLGARRYSSQFKFNENNVLPFQTVVLDEASMADQTMMSHLMKALSPNARLILLGDKDQLASVEAGSVLGDICFRADIKFSANTAEWLSKMGTSLPVEHIALKPNLMNDFVTLLTQNYRFTSKSGIGQLAQSINSGNTKESLSIIHSNQFNDINLTLFNTHLELIKQLEQIAENYFIPFHKNIEPDGIFERWQKFQLLAVHRRGPYGTQYLNRQIERILSTRQLIPKHQEWYAGRPVIINRNDYTLKLYNGDVGICMPDEKGELQVYFQQKDEIRAIAPARLSDYDSAYVLTVHKSQGDEFENVGLILPAKDSKVLSRELIYTAVTRARKSVEIIGPRNVLEWAIANKIKRSSGLADRFW